jgi:hypothetical protein
LALPRDFYLIELIVEFIWPVNCIMNLVGNRNGRPMQCPSGSEMPDRDGLWNEHPYGGTAKLMHCRAHKMNPIAADQRAAPGRVSGTLRSRI